MNIDDLTLERKMGSINYLLIVKKERLVWKLY